jgi:hypothetical protein
VLPIAAPFALPKAVTGADWAEWADGARDKMASLLWDLAWSRFSLSQGLYHHADDEHPSSACATSFSETSAGDAADRLFFVPFATSSPAHAILRRKNLWQRKGAYVILHSRTASSPGIPRLEYQIFPDRARVRTLPAFVPASDTVACAPWCCACGVAKGCAVAGCRALCPAQRRPACSEPAATRARHLHRKKGVMLMCAAVETRSCR